MASHLERWNAYFILDESGKPTNVLSNKLGITDQLHLDRAERRITHDAAQALTAGHVVVDKTFDLSHLRSIHKALFEQIYPWAGKVRTVAISKGFTDFALPGPEISHAIRQAEQTIRNNDWPTLNDRAFAAQLATTFAWINYAHPFREGNGRTTRIFLQDVAALANRQLHFERIHPDAWNQRSAFSSPDRGSNLPHPEHMTEVFEHISSPLQRQHGTLIDQLRKRAQQIQAERRDLRSPEPERRESRER